MVAHLTIAHKWSKSGISISYIKKRVVKSKSFLSEKIYFTLHMRNMFWSTILYMYHGVNRPVA